MTDAELMTAIEAKATARGLDLDSLYDRLGIHYVTFWRIKTGRSQASRETYTRMQAVAGEMDGTRKAKNGKERGK